MLPNVGVDIVEIKRLAKLQNNKAFLKRVFTRQEVAYCQARKHAAQHLAVRFAANEAVWKAVGNRKLLHRDIQVWNRPDGKPEIRFPASFKGLARRVAISLSHGRDYAIAMAVFQKR